MKRAIFAQEGTIATRRPVNNCQQPVC